VSGTYYNGPNNNGIGATLTVAASSLTIDSVACAVGDRVLLQTQTNTYEQGIYVVTSIGSTVVLTRADDMQSIEQMKAGQYVSVGAGSSLAGNFYSLVEPLPQVIGSDAVVFNADPSAGGVSFSGGASTANALVVFSNTSGDIKAATGASTFGQDLAVTGALSSTTSFDCSAGDITAGSDANAGVFVSYPATTASGTLKLAAVDSSSDVAVTISNADHGQASVYSIPDGGQATAEFIISDSAGTQHITSGNFTVDVGTISSGLAAGGFAGKFSAFSTTASMGSLNMLAVDNAGDFAVTISNASHGQASVISIPDGGQATAEFIISDSAGTQHITSGNLEVDAGNILAGIDATAGYFESHPSTTASGTLRLAAVDSSADVAVTISNADHGQATVYSIPDVGAATGQFLVKTAALVDGQLIKASGTAGKVVDAGFSVIANTTAAYGGGGTSNAFTATGLAATSIVTASILTSTNAVSIAKVVPTANTLTITFSADPGASTTVSYIAITPAV